MKIITWFVVFLFSFIFFYLLVDFFVLSSIANVKIVAEPGQDDRLRIYFSNGTRDGKFTQEKSVQSQHLKKDTKSLISLNLVNRIGKHIRIDPILNEGSIKIFSIKIQSQFGDPIVFNAEQISKYFRTSHNSNMTLKNGFVEILSVGPDPQLELTEPVKFSNFIFGIILPLFLSVLFTVIVKNISIRNIYAIKDIDEKTPTTTRNIKALDGLRGMAALMVIAAHSSPYFKGLGVFGVWIFFCLSGFLLSIPFVNKPSLITSSSYLNHYFFRRIKRILPMYYFMIAVLQLSKGNIEIFVRHATFIQGDSIFWTIPQEMFFYMILPLVLVINYFLCRGNIKIMFFLTLIMAIFMNHNVSTSLLYIYGNNRKVPLWIGIFLTGVCISYFYHSSYARFITERSKLFHNICSISLLSILLMTSHYSSDYLLLLKGFFNPAKVELYAFLSALLILFSISSEGSILNKLMSWYPLRAVGIVGFSFYLLHPNVLDMIKAISFRMIGETPTPIMLLTIGIPSTYFASIITYSLIERPFIRRS